MTAVSDAQDILLADAAQGVLDRNVEGISSIRWQTEIGCAVHELIQETFAITDAK
jgi:hypothetical protein